MPQPALKEKSVLASENQAIGNCYEWGFLSEFAQQRKANL
jgi:hypothetical protein